MAKKKLSIEEFVNAGYLQEINRLYLHPRGLALEVEIDDDGDMQLGDIWDCRQDPEGVLFDEEVTDTQDFRLNVMKQKVLTEMAFEKRKEILGFVEQPAEKKEKKIEENK